MQSLTILLIAEILNLAIYKKSAQSQAWEKLIVLKSSA
jgi:hypothetical protein